MDIGRLKQILSKAEIDYEMGIILEKRGHS